MKKYFIYAVSALALAGCSSDDFLGGQPSPTKLTDNNVINFNGDRSSTTRATKEGSDAAGKLGKKFFVYGTKQTTDTEKADGTDEQTVYMNYLVTFDDGTANTTVSNTAGWEYVGVDNSYKTAVTPNVGDKSQTIKYWDYSAPSYVFYACSAHGDDLSKNNGKVKIEKITDASAEPNPTVYKKGYKVTLKDGAHPENLYFSDRKVLTKSSNAVHGEKDVYGGEVNLTFRNSMTKVRVAFYETIPGYKVTINNFYKTENTQNTQSTAVTDKFVADLKNTPLAMSANGTKYKVVYYESGDLVNQPRMIATENGAEKTVLTLGTNLFGNPLGTEKTSPTYDTNAGAYTWFLPQTENSSKLNLKVDYTLTSTDGSTETIKVKGATAEVPAELLCWKPNYAYTYLFKISTNTNGGTGGTTDPAGLYPITFDASVVETADGNAEYITTVSEASITTFAVKDNMYVHDASEYTAGSDIYATVVEGDALQKLTINTNGANTKVYKIADSYALTANEAQVAEWVANSKTDHYSDYTSDVSVSVQTKVPSGDGSTITLANSATALKLAGITTGTYAIEYTNTNAWTGSYKPVYKVIKVVNN